MKDAEYYMQHEDEFGSLSEEDKAKVFEGGLPEGETTSDTPPDVAGNTTQPDLPEQKEEPGKAAEPVVLAKDGKNTIPFSELENARSETKRLELVAQQQAQMIADLQAAKEQDAETGGTEAQAKVIEDYAGDYPELVEDLSPHLRRIVDARVSEQAAMLKAEMDAVLAPLRESAAQQVAQAHYQAIAAKHPDFEALASSSGLQGWIESRPKFVQQEYQRVFDQGSAEEVIAMLDEYRGSNPKASPASTASEEAPRAPVRPTVPTSLSDVPGASMAHHDEAAAIMELPTTSMIGKFNGMTPDKIEELMSRLL